ncbi:MMPL family transporter [Streptomyces sp. NPDC101150]|uniref:MMPL family transporter n=1 Tax=Streptomyces sp. NPDC101150 TaxID=3366114 RepID=UPI0038186855
MKTWSRARAQVVLLLAVVAALVTLWQTAPAMARFASDGTVAEGTPAARAQQEAERLGLLRPDLVLLVADPGGAPVGEASVRRRIGALVRIVAADHGVKGTRSAAEGQEVGLLSRDGRSAMVQAQLGGAVRQREKSAERIVAKVRDAVPGLRVRASGRAWTTAVISRQTKMDLLRGELLAAPLIALLLVLIYGSVISALLPVVIGALSVLCAIPVLGLLARFIEVSEFAVNASSAVGFALAVDYTLFIMARYREHFAYDAPPFGALAVALHTSGRTVVFSAAAVTVALTAVAIVPVPVLRALVLACVTVTLLSALAAWTVLPAALILLGPRIGRLDPLYRWRRHQLGRPSPLWRVVARTVTARPMLAGVSALLLLAVMAWPSTHTRLGTADESVLPVAGPAAVAAEQQRVDFAFSPERLLTVIVTADRQELTAYQTVLSALPHVSAVVAAPGPEIPRPAPGPARSQMPGQVPGHVPGSVTRAVIVASDVPPGSREGAALVRALRTSAAPGPVLVAGRAADIADTVDAVRGALPLAAFVLVAGLIALLALYTRSIVAPLKAVIVAAVTTGSSLGVIVAVFQDGHARTVLGPFTASGSLDCSLLLYTLALTLAISLDYEVFLLGRVKEEYDRGGDNRAAVIEGIAHTGRLMTSAAACVAISAAALVTSGLATLKLLGLGIAVTVLVDAVIVRGVLVPAVMAALGAGNWWNPVPASWSRPRRPRPAVPPAPREAPRHRTPDRL